MALSRVPPTQVGTLNRLFGELGRSLDARSEGGARISDGEAQRIVGQLQRLPQSERTQAEQALRELLVNDFFTVTPNARQAFARALGVQTQELEPRARAELVGLASARSAFQAGVQAVSKAPQLDRKTMKKIVTGAETYLDRPAQGYLAAVLRNASRDGTVKLDSDARKDFTRWVGGLEGDQSVSKWSENFDMRGAGQVDYLSQLMASGMCFEDLVAAFMMHVVGQLQKATEEKMEELQGVERNQAKREVAPGGAGGNPSRLNELFHRRGLDRPASPEGAAEVGTLAADVTAAQGTSPRVASPGAASGVPASQGDYATQTRRNLEAVVQSVHAHMSASDDTPGVIDRKEAMQIAEKFDRLEGPVAPLVARALANTLRSTPGVDLQSETFEPIVAWIKKSLGDDIDLSSLPRRTPGEATDPIARQLRNSDKLEDKIASFVVDTLMSSEMGLKDKMKDLKWLTSEMFADPKAGPALQEVIAPRPESAPALQPLAETGASMTSQQATAQHATAQHATAQQATAQQATAQQASSGPLPDPWFEAPSEGVPPPARPRPTGDAVGAPAAAARPEAQGSPARAGASRAPSSSVARGVSGGAPAAAPTSASRVEAPSADALRRLASEAPSASPALSEAAEPKSRQMLWEELKSLQNELAQVMQAMSNMLNSMHQNAMNSIRAIR